MKKFLFIIAFLVPFLFSSCSDDDNNNDSQTELYKTVTTYYDGDTSTVLFENGLKISTDYPYDTHYTYDTSGTLIAKTDFNFSQYPGISNYIYDNSGRLIQIAQEDRLSTFTYDDINKTINGSFYFNDEGKIYRFTNYTDFTDTQIHNDYSVVFEGGLPVKFISKRSTGIWGGPMGPPQITETIYTYDNEHDPSLMGIKEAAFEINATLLSDTNSFVGFGNFMGDGHTPITSKYITQIASEDGISNFHYEFKSNGLPVKVILEYNGEIVGETVYYYR